MSLTFLVRLRDRVVGYRSTHDQCNDYYLVQSTDTDSVYSLKSLHLYFHRLSVEWNTTSKSKHSTTITPLSEISVIPVSSFQH
ncbi:hypothetical protein IF2G_01158 [Cordyceps javanica]|nr:hypothetical protein IF2G_01158 [Cordyceps javanica]